MVKDSRSTTGEDRLESLMLILTVKIILIFTTILHAFDTFAVQMVQYIARKRNRINDIKIPKLLLDKA